MKTSLFLAGPTLAILSISLLPTGTAMAQPITPDRDLLPPIAVEAPGRVSRSQKPAQRTVAHHTAYHGKSTSWECIGGCVTSFKSGDRPWVGCSVSSGQLSGTCRNIGPGGVPYKTYLECTETGHDLGFRANEFSWYCSSLALK